jgi:putative lipoprotein
MFSLRYDATRVVPAGRYVVSARIIDGAVTLFSSAAASPVLTQGRGSVANLVVIKTESSPAPAPTPAPKDPAPAPKPTPTPTP